MRIALTSHTPARTLGTHRGPGLLFEALRCMTGRKSGCVGADAGRQAGGTIEGPSDRLPVFSVAAQWEERGLGRRCRFQEGGVF